MVENTERSDFMKMVDDVRLAEQEADEILNAAKINADKILRAAKEDVQKQNAEFVDSVVKMKDLLLEEGSKEIEAEVQKTVKKANTDAEKIRKALLGKKDIDQLVEDFLSLSE